MVAPVANIPDWISNNCTRLLVNRDIVGTFRPENMNDVILQGDCDEGVRELCRLIGWEEELDRIYNDLK
jgi:NAD-dependent histone deacetylase SIR2